MKQSKKLFGQQLKSVFPFSWKDACRTLIILLLITLISVAAERLFYDKNYVVVFYLLGVVLVSRFTQGYLWGILTSLFSVFSMNFLFTFPYYAFNFTIEGYPVTFLVMLLISVITSALTTRVKEQGDVLLEAEKEKMRSNLLRAISHDLRTPLTSILGASSALLENGEVIDREAHDKFLCDIKENSEWLIRMVENLLSVTRISEGGATVTKSPEAVEEIVAEAVSRVHKTYPTQEIHVKVPDELLIVEMDPTLIEQVIINLVENSIKHSGKKVTIDITVIFDKKNAVFSVADNGRGFSKKDLPYLFSGGGETSMRSSDSSRGMGIGLSICSSIIKAHSGRIEAKNKPGRGAIVTFTLPIEGGSGHE